MYRNRFGTINEQNTAMSKEQTPVSANLGIEGVYDNKSHDAIMTYLIPTRLAQIRTIQDNFRVSIATGCPQSSDCPSSVNPSR